jgi:cation diffusion facilitator family transporter
MMSEEEEATERRFEEGEIVAKVSIVAMLCLTILKGLVGWYYNSVALWADAVNSFSDIFASALVLSGLHLTGRKPSDRFPYGYYRAENLASFIVSLLVIFSGAEIIWESIGTLIQPMEIVGNILPLAAAAISASTYYALARYKKSVGKRIGSQSLVADSKHSKADVYASLLVFAGIGLSLLGIGIVEVAVALIVGVYVVKEGLELSKESVLTLMDASPYPDKSKEMKQVAEEIPGVLDIHDMRLRQAGPVIFAEAHITVVRNLSIEEAHALSDKIEEELRRVVPDLETVTIHMDPEESHTLRVAVPVEADEGRDSRVLKHFGRIPVFGVADLEDEKIENLHFVHNPGHEADRRRGVKTVDALSQESVDAVVVGDIGRSPFDMLRGRFITIFRLPDGVKDLEAVLDMVAKDELDRMVEPPESRGEGREDTRRGGNGND